MDNCHVKLDTVAVVARTKKDEQPETVQRVGTVVDMDYFKRLVTLRFKDGSTEIFPMRPDVDM